MSVPDGAQCAYHPQLSAVHVCHRCGNFFCEDCARRTRPEAIPLCKSCWELRGQKVEPYKVHSETRLQSAGLVIGCICIVPIPALILASLVVNGIAIARATDGAAREVRWKPIVGLCVTLFGIVELVVAGSCGHEATVCLDAPPIAPTAHENGGEVFGLRSQG